VKSYLLRPKGWVFRLSGDSWTLVHTFEGNDTIDAESFEEVGLDMSRWWIPSSS
jgi:hypothetical protein